MGCSGSVPATSDISLKPAIAAVTSSIPKGELILKDLPDVVEKVIDSLKDSDLKNLPVESAENSNLPDSKEVTSAANKNDIQDTNKKSSTQEVTQGNPTDSVSSSSKQSEPEQLEANNKTNNKNSSTISSDIDSLRTSSPESEIEEALANNNDPPTPKPTFSELQNLVVGPVNTIIKSHIKPVETFLSQAGEKNPVIDNTDKSEDNIIPISRRDITEWEKQADLLAITQKYNPIEVMRKLRRENGRERIGSGFIVRNEFKPKIIQNIFEDLSEFLPLQSPHRSRLSSARSERSVQVIAASELDDSEKCSKKENEESKTQKPKPEITLKKSPARKTKESFLLVPTNVRGVPSPSPHKVRERCTVCYNKYKH